MSQRSKRVHYTPAQSEEENLAVLRYLLAGQASGRPVDRNKLRALVGDARGAVGAAVANATAILESRYGMTVKMLPTKEYVLVSTLDDAYRGLVSRAATPANATFMAVVMLVNVLILLNRDSMPLGEIKKHLRLHGIDLSDGTARKLLLWRYFSDRAPDLPPDPDANTRDLALWDIGSRSTLVFSKQQIFGLLMTVLWPAEAGEEAVRERHPDQYESLKQLVDRSPFGI